MKWSQLSAEGSTTSLWLIWRQEMQCLTSSKLAGSAGPPASSSKKLETPATPWTALSRTCQELYVSSISSNSNQNKLNSPFTSHSMTRSTARTLIWAWNTPWRTSISAEESFLGTKIEAGTSFMRWMDLWSAVHPKGEASRQRQQ